MLLCCAVPVRVLVLCLCSAVLPLHSAVAYACILFAVLITCACPHGVPPPHLLTPPTPGAPACLQGSCESRRIYDVRPQAFEPISQFSPAYFWK